MPVSICSLKMFTYCNFSDQPGTDGDDDDDDDGWDCSDLPRGCADMLYAECGAGKKCHDTSRLLEPSEFIGLVVLAAALVVAVPTTAVFLVQRRRARARLQASLLSRRAATVELLQRFLPDADVDNVMLPPHSADFGPHSPCIASGGGGSVYVVATHAPNRNSRSSPNQHRRLSWSASQDAIAVLFCFIDLRLSVCCCWRWWRWWWVAVVAVVGCRFFAGFPVVNALVLSPSCSCSPLSPCPR
jgi:hypothetical protein